MRGSKIYYPPISAITELSPNLCMCYDVIFRQNWRAPYHFLLLNSKINREPDFRLSTVILKIFCACGHMNTLITDSGRASNWTHILSKIGLVGITWFSHWLLCQEWRWFQLNFASLGPIYYVNQYVLVIRQFSGHQHTSSKYLVLPCYVAPDFNEE